VRIEAEFLKLPIPFGVRLAETFDIDAAWETAFSRCLDELGSKERERECQIDLPHGASLALCQLLASVTEPIKSQWRLRAMAHKRQARSFGALGPLIVSGYSARQEDFAGSL